jgi:hypothetical protein
MVISLFGLKDDEQRERYRRIVEAFDGDTVDAEDDLWKATHALVESGEDGLATVERLRSAGLPTAVPVLGVEWIDESVKNRQTEDFKPYLIEGHHDFVE